MRIFDLIEGARIARRIGDSVSKAMKQGEDPLTSSKRDVQEAVNYTIVVAHLRKTQPNTANQVIRTIDEWLAGLTANKAQAFRNVVGEVFTDLTTKFKDQADAMEKALDVATGVLVDFAILPNHEARTEHAIGSGLFAKRPALEQLLEWRQKRNENLKEALRRLGLYHH